jgi:hypothetical protein
MMFHMVGDATAVQQRHPGDTDIQPGVEDGITLTRVRQY